MSARLLSRCLFAGAIVAMAPALARAEEWRVDLDPDRTQVTFTLKATLHTVEGSAQLASGSLVIDTETGAVTGEVVVDAASVDTGNNGRDNKMHGKVLLSAEHPQIVLQPSRVEGALTVGSSTEVAVVGRVVLLGEPHPISIPMKVRIDATNFSVEAVFTIPYVEWGLKDPSTFVLRVAKEIQVRVTAEGTITVEDRE